MNTYAITIKKTRGTPTVSDYEDYLLWLSEKVVIYNVNYETTRGLHIHFRVKTDLTLTPKDSRLYRYKYGWNILCRPEYYEQGWIKYITKDSKTDEIKALKNDMIQEDLYCADPRVKSPTIIIEPKPDFVENAERIFEKLTHRLF